MNRLTSRRRASLLFVCAVGALFLLGLALQLFSLTFWALFAYAAGGGLIALGLIGLWYRLATHIARLSDELRWVRENGGSPSPSGGAMIGRAAGIRQPVTTTYLEQEVQLLETHEAWLTLEEADLRNTRKACIGSLDNLRGKLPEEVTPTHALLAGFLESQAAVTKPALIFSTTSAFAEEPWVQGIDASGNWIMQDLIRLREWANRHGSLMVLFDDGGLSVGVNTEAIKNVFHLFVSGPAPTEGIDEAPVPRSISYMYNLRDMLIQAAPEAENVE